MGRKDKIYHLCNISPKVIFRNEEDYLIAICRLAACAYATSTEVWAYSFMSTHFHLVVKSENIVEFIKMYKINISVWHNNKYASNIQVNIGRRELINQGDIKTAVNYVLKNPIHHKIADVAFKYPYSSAHIYFKDYIYPGEYFIGERSAQLYKKPSELPSRTYRKLFASHHVPDKYLLIKDKIVLPDTFVKVKTIENLYYGVRDFLYNMNKPLKEELEMFENDNNTQSLNETRVNLYGKLTDMQVCRIVDDIIAPKTYTQVTLEEKTQLFKLLMQKGVDKFQFARVV